MKHLSIFRDFLISGTIGGAVSYLSTLYYSNPNYIKIAAYLWGIPASFFFLLFIGFNISNKAAYDISIHAGIGVFVTLLSIIISILLFDLGKKPLIFINIIIIITSIFIYSNWKLYEL